MTLRFIKSVFVAILSFGKSLTAQNVKCAIFFNQPCLARPRFIDLNPDELCYQPFMVSLDRCNRG